MSTGSYYQLGNSRPIARFGFPPFFRSFVYQTLLEPHPILSN